MIHPTHAERLAAARAGTPLPPAAELDEVRLALMAMDALHASQRRRLVMEEATLEGLRTKLRKAETIVTVKARP